MKKLSVIVLLVVLMLAVPVVGAGAPQNCLGGQLSIVAQNTDTGVSGEVQNWVNLGPGAWGNRISGFHADFCVANNGNI